MICKGCGKEIPNDLVKCPFCELPLAGETEEPQAPGFEMPQEQVKEELQVSVKEEPQAPVSEETPAASEKESELSEESFDEKLQAFLDSASSITESAKPAEPVKTNTVNSGVKAKSAAATRLDEYLSDPVEAPRGRAAGASFTEGLKSSKTAEELKRLGKSVADDVRSATDKAGKAIGEKVSVEKVDKATEKVRSMKKYFVIAAVLIAVIVILSGISSLIDKAKPDYYVVGTLSIDPNEYHYERDDWSGVNYFEFDDNSRITIINDVQKPDKVSESDWNDLRASVLYSASIDRIVYVGDPIVIEYSLDSKAAMAFEKKYKCHLFTNPDGDSQTIVLEPPKAYTSVDELLAEKSDVLAAIRTYTSNNIKSDGDDLLSVELFLALPETETEKTGSYVISIAKHIEHGFFDDEERYQLEFWGGPFDETACIEYIGDDYRNKIDHFYNWTDNYDEAIDICKNGDTYGVPAVNYRLEKINLD